MKICALNGGPRKTWNTATMLDYCLKGAASMGEDVEVERIDLFDHTYTGCRSCFACKLNGPSYGRCSYQDAAKALLEKVSAADGVVCGSPIYFHDITAQLRGFLERSSSSIIPSKRAGPA